MSPGPLGAISGHLSVAGRCAISFSATGPLEPAGLHAGMFEAAVRPAASPRTCSAPGTWKRGTVASGARAAAPARSPSSTTGRGSTSRAAGTISAGRSPAATSRLSSTAGTFTLAGVLPYRVHARGELQRGADLPVMPRRARRHARQGQLQLRARRRRPVRRSRQRHWRGGLVAARDLGGRRPRHRHQPARAARRSARQHELRISRLTGAASRRSGDLSARLQQSRAASCAACGPASGRHAHALGCDLELQQCARWARQAPASRSTGGSTTQVDLRFALSYPRPEPARRWQPRPAEGLRLAARHARRSGCRGSAHGSGVEYEGLKLERARCGHRLQSRTPPGRSRRSTRGCMS